MTSDEYFASFYDISDNTGEVSQAQSYDSFANHFVNPQHSETSYRQPPSQAWNSSYYATTQDPGGHIRAAETLHHLGITANGTSNLPSHASSLSSTNTSQSGYSLPHPHSPNYSTQYSSSVTTQYPTVPNVASPIDQLGLGNNTRTSLHSMVNHPRHDKVSASATSNCNQRPRKHSSNVTVDNFQSYRPLPETQHQQEVEKAGSEVIHAAKDTKLSEQPHIDESSSVEIFGKEREVTNNMGQTQRIESDRQRKAAKPDEMSFIIVPTDDNEEGDDEDQIRKLMAQIRALNAKNPALVAKVWDEERKAHQASQSSQIQHRPSVKFTSMKTSETKQTSTVTKTSAPNPQFQIPADAATVVTSETPVISSASTTSQRISICPPEMRGKVSFVASTWLSNVPENHNKRITPEVIYEILNESLSYDELCEILKGKGLKIDRGAFARHILSEVPNINTLPNWRIANSSNQSIISKSLHQRQDPQQSNMSSFYVEDKILQGAQIICSTPSPTPITVATLTANTDITMPTNKDETDKKIISKEQAARKRNFSELIDLTLLSDEDDGSIQAQKQARLEESAHSVRLHNHFQHGSHSYMPSKEPNPSFDVPQDIQRKTHPSSTAAPINSALNQPQKIVRELEASTYTKRSHTTPTIPLIDEALSQMPDIVKPIDRRKVYRRTGYNINTIARDVLLATGKHPEQRAINAHLESLKHIFKAVDNNSDLSTFKWDIVDPGEPPAYMLKGVYEDADADDEEEKKEEGTQAKPQIQRVRSMQTSMVRSAPVAKHERDISYISASAPERVHSHPTLPTKRGRPRGRPPRNSCPSSSTRESPGERLTVKHGTPDFSSPALNHSMARTITMNAQNTSSNTKIEAYSDSPPAFVDGKGTGYSAFKRYDEHGNEVKKRGRPVGWRKAIHGSAAAKVNARQKPSALKNDPGQRRPPVTAQRDRKTPRIFGVFECRWSNCNAKLHNLETLRKHVYKIHNKLTTYGTFECHWNNCDENIQSVDSRNQRPPQKRPGFYSESIWKAHIELAHFGHIAWQLGDGPASGVSGEEDEL
jgi:hypothetical protein